MYLLRSTPMEQMLAYDWTPQTQADTLQQVQGSFDKR
jgi:hypothetical protein